MGGVASFASGFVGGYASSVFGSATQYQANQFAEGSPFNYYAGQVISGVLAEETSSYLKTGSLIMPWDAQFGSGLALGFGAGYSGEYFQGAYDNTVRAMVYGSAVSEVPGAVCVRLGWGC